MKKFGNKAKLYSDKNSNNNSKSSFNLQNPPSNNLFKENNKNNSVNPDVNNENYSYSKINFLFNDDTKFEFKKCSKRNLYRQESPLRDSQEFSQENHSNENYYDYNFLNNKQNGNFDHNNNNTNDENNLFSFKDASNRKNIINLEECEENNLYIILNLNENASKEDIKKAYRELSRKFHPDKCGSSEQFLKINQAYNILSNETCKNLYDQYSFNSFSMIDIILREEQV